VQYVLAAEGMEMTNSRITLHPDTVRNRIAALGMRFAGMLTQSIRHRLYYRMNREIAR